MYLRARGINFVSVFTVFCLDFRNRPTGWYFCNCSLYLHHLNMWWYLPQFERAQASILVKWWGHLSVFHMWVTFTWICIILSDWNNNVLINMSLHMYICDDIYHNSKETGNARLTEYTLYPVSCRKQVNLIIKENMEIVPNSGKYHHMFKWCR
jgi:uncharacterized protein YlaI